jgi:septal ring factor EnvC (AmiA/AmiB activator)
MMKWIGNFAASKVSGYALIALLLAAGGAAIWFWSEIKEFGSLSEKAEQQASTIEAQKQELANLQAKIAAKEAVLASQLKRTTALRQKAEATRQEIREALNDAPQSYIDARNIVVPERLRFGPSRQDDGAEP